MLISKLKNKSVFIISILALSIVLILISSCFFERFQNINYYNLTFELVIALGASILLLSIQGYKKLKFHKALSLGYLCLFVSYFVDGIDQIFIHSIVYTVVMEKMTLLFAALFIYIGSKQWMLNYRKISLTDELTQLSNRKHTVEMITSEIDRCQKKKTLFCMAIIDIDFFKKINDQYGHYSGDKVLSDFAHLLDKFKSEGDILGRWGGEEFVMLFKSTKKKQAMEKAEKLRQIIEMHNFVLGDKRLSLTASFGVAECQFTTNGFKNIFIAADKALYMAKNNGRNKVM